MTRAAKALALMNKKEDTALVPVTQEHQQLTLYNSYNPDSESYSIYSFPEKLVEQEQKGLEQEMNLMFKELTEMEEMIKGN
jgi:hypothetical protein